MELSIQSQEVFPYTQYTPAYICICICIERVLYYKVFCSYGHLTKQSKNLEQLACLLSSADTSLVNMNAKRIKTRDVENLVMF